MKPIGLIGIGNPFMGDDGIGPLLIQQVRASAVFDDRVCFIDGGTGGMLIVHELARLDAAVIVDAGDFGGVPGAYHIFSARQMVSVDGPDAPSQLTSSRQEHSISGNFCTEKSAHYKPATGKRLSGFSIHEWDLMKTIEISMALQELPQPLCIMVIQPRIVAPFPDISPALQVRIPRYENVLHSLLSALLFEKGHHSISAPP